MEPKIGENILSLSSYLQALRVKHRDLSDQVDAMQNLPAADDHKITDLKKQKLAAKDAMMRIQTA